MMEGVSFTVQGIPQPKGSMRYVGKGKMLPQGNPDNLNAWRNDVKAAARQAMGESLLFTGPIRLQVDFSLSYPRSSIRKYQHGWVLPTKKPDMDKLLRSVCDHLTGVVWVDDAQVCFTMMNKQYAWNDKPGAFIAVHHLDDEWMKRYAATRNLITQAIEEEMELYADG